MKIVIISLVALSAAGVTGTALLQVAASTGSFVQERQGDEDKLYALVKQAREDVRGARVAAGLHAHAAGPHIDPKGHHANDTGAQLERENREREGKGHEDGEGRGEGGGHKEGGERGGDRGHKEGGEHGGEKGHGEGGERGGEGDEGAVGAKSLSKLDKHDKVYKNGARLILQYDPNTEAFIGTVENTTPKTLRAVRVEIHLSNGMELGPTKRIDLKPGQKTPVELGGFGENFTSWSTHPEAGVEAGHGSGGEGGEGSGGHAERERGEHGGGRGEGGDKPAAAKLHPVYNEIKLLRGEMKAFTADLAAKNKK